MKRILIVEDNPLNLELVTQLLEDDFVLTTAVDGAAGVQAAKQMRPDLILMDLSLPILDGWEATRQLRKDPLFAKTPIIALSAHVTKLHIDDALAAGCDAFLTKPLDEELLRSKIAELLDRPVASVR